MSQSTNDTPRDDGSETKLQVSLKQSYVAQILMCLIGAGSGSGLTYAVQKQQVADNLAVTTRYEAQVDARLTRIEVQMDNIREALQELKQDNKEYNRRGRESLSQRQRAQVERE